MDGESADEASAGETRMGSPSVRSHRYVASQWSGDRSRPKVSDQNEANFNDPRWRSISSSLGA